MRPWHPAARDRTVAGFLARYVAAGHAYPATEAEHEAALAWMRTPEGERAWEGAAAEAFARGPVLADAPPALAEA